MSDKDAGDASWIAKYRAEAAARRADRRDKSAAKAPLVAKATNGVFTVRLAPDAKPMSAFGGISKVVGRSRINIPEFKLRRG
jgi:hypothetical protein